MLISQFWFMCIMILFLARALHIVVIVYNLVWNVCFSLQDLELSNDFPFEIVANPDQSITLKWEFAGEKIQVKVYDMGEDINEHDEDGGSAMSEFSLIALIDKGKGPSLEFWCELDDDGLHIESMLLKSDDGYDDGNEPEFS